MKPIDRQTDDELIASLRRAASLPDAPAAAVQAAIGLFERPARDWTALGRAAVRQLRAVLGFDSWATGPLALGLRGAGPTAARQLVYCAEGHDIDLRIEPVAALWRVGGQVLGPEAPGRIELQPEGAALQPVQHAAIDALGEFHFEVVPAGIYRLRLQFETATVELPPLDIGPRRG